MINTVNKEKNKAKTINLIKINSLINFKIKNEYL